MRNIVADIETALKRGCSPFTLQDVLKAHELGNLHLVIGNNMTGSYWERLGKLEVVHLAGKWSDDEGAMMMEVFQDAAKARGIPWVIQGRPGWMRFLKMRGILQ